MRLVAFACATAVLFVSTNAMAASATKLPKGAKQLTKAEIVAAYDGKTYKWKHPAGDKGTGTTTYNSRTETVEGTFKVGSVAGEFVGKISWKGDAYCFSTTGKGKDNWGPVTCHLMFKDGDTIYETNKKKVVESINTPQ